MKSFFKQSVVVSLTFLAKRVLKKYQPAVIAVTGNVGKTSAKDAIAAVIGKSHYVRKSEKSFNSEIGIPLTVLGLKNAWSDPLRWLSNFWEGILVLLLPNHYPRWLVLEVGADRPKDIKKAASWLSPDIAVFTRVGEIPVHVEFFGSADRLFLEKAELAKALKGTGALVLNYDDERIRGLKEGAKAEVFTYGFSEEADVYASHREIIYNKEGFPTGMSFRVNHKGASVPVVLSGTVGFHQIYSILAACSVAVAIDMNLVLAVEALVDHKHPNGRLTILPGKNSSIILDDTYNASPTATEAALDALASLESKGRKIAVLGDMMELGKFSEEAHHNIGRKVKECADIFIGVGVRMERACEEAKKAKMKATSIKHFPNSTIAGEYLTRFVKEGDTVLLKGSQSMRMERAVKEILFDQEKAKEQLVRQDDDWAER